MPRTASGTYFKSSSFSGLVGFAEHGKQVGARQQFAG